MVSVRKQVFVEYFISGLASVIIGALGYVSDSPATTILALIISLAEAGLNVVVKVKKRQKDDDLSFENKFRAAYMTITLFMMAASIAGIIYILAGNSMSAPIPFDLRMLFIIGVVNIVFYVYFIYFEKVGE